MTRPRKPLTPGGNRSPGVVVTQAARNRFFEAIIDEAPEVLLDLAATAGLSHEAPSDERQSENPQLSPGEPRLSPPDVGRWLALDLASWGKRWYLEDAWCIERARKTLAMWSEFPGTTGTRWALESYEVPWPVPIRQDWISGWDPLLESEADFDKRIGAHKAEVEKALRGAGWTYAPTKDDALEHFRWLVHNQVRGVHVPALADRYKKGERTIRNALKEAAEVLGLTRRTVKPGPSKGSTKSPAGPKSGDRSV